MLRKFFCGAKNSIFANCPKRVLPKFGRDRTEVRGVSEQFPSVRLNVRPDRKLLKSTCLKIFFESREGRGKLIWADGSCYVGGRASVR